MKEVIYYYQFVKRKDKFSRISKSSTKNKKDIFEEKEKLVEIIAYCLMPTHLHLILKQIKDNGISIYMNNVLNSYTRYFNIKHKRKGPLWEGPFKNVLIKTDEQLLHLTRYLHLNPVTAFLVNKPEEWKFSSYNEFILKVNPQEKICNFQNFLDISPNSYKIFVEDRIAYQRELAKIKSLILEPLSLCTPPRWTEVKNV